MALSSLAHAQAIQTGNSLSGALALPGVGGHVQSSDSQKQKVSFIVKDSTLGYVVRAMANDAGFKIWFDKQHAVYGRRVTVNVKDRPIMDAFVDVLKGTNLEALIASDGETIVLRQVEARPSSDSARKGNINGQVIDSSSGKPIAGATVVATSIGQRTITDERGAFVFKGVPAGEQSIQVRLIGYRTGFASVNLVPGKAASVTISLVANAASLNEVVTTATGMQRRVEVPSDIVRIDPEKIMERAPVQNFTDLLEAAQVPGVLVTRGNGNPGSPSRIRIRGLRSITQSNDPVVIVDGNWIDATVGSPSGFDDIDPATIETVEIVRGPSASTLYGQDAANGVIVITTKKGRAGPSRWRASYNRSWGQTYGSMPLSYVGFGYGLLDGRRQNCPIRQVASGNCLQDSVAVFDPNHPLVSREGGEVSHRMVASVDGGTATTTYSLTATANRTLGVRRIAPVDLVRYRILNVPISNEFLEPAKQEVNTITTGLTMTPRQNITIGLTVSGSQNRISDNSIQPDYGGISGTTADRDYSLDTTSFFTEIGNGQITRIEATESPTRRSNILFGGRVDWRVLNGGVISANAGVSRTQEDVTGFTRNIHCVRAVCVDTLGRRLERSNGRTELSGRLNMSKPLDLGSFSRVLDLLPAFGADYRKTETSMLGGSMINIPPGERSFAGGSNPVINHSSRSTIVAGWYANMRVGILSRIYFDVGARQDVGSAIRSIGKGATYPKIGGSWLVSDESFWPRSLPIETFRVRTAVGYAAIQPDFFDIHGGYRHAPVFVDGKYVSALYLDAFGNTSLRPERSMEIETGFDADLFQDRVNLIVTYAHSENLNTMINRSLPPSAGNHRSSRIRKENVARVRNRNFEFTGSVRALETRSARLELSHTMTMRDNVVMQLGTGVTPFNTNNIGRIEEGSPLAGVWVNHIVGFHDKNNDGLLGRDEIVLGDSLIYAGWTQPRYEASYGVNLNLLGRFTIDTRLSYRSRYVQHYNRNNRYGMESIEAPLEEQASALASRINNRRPISDLRWNSASATYHLPLSVINAMKLRTMSVSLKGSNLGLWSNYAGRDPGVNSAMLSSEIAREDGNEVSRPRQFVLDVTIGF